MVAFCHEVITIRADNKSNDSDDDVDSDEVHDVDFDDEKPRRKETMQQFAQRELFIKDSYKIDFQTYMIDGDCTLRLYKTASMLLHGMLPYMFCDWVVI
ncbi:hypothetical protein KIN20_024040 [Parelaphostrongylus tenuis]|uniref:Uncharacterized protein n=1 Tax=Parelaphostrongylus tenuis TaxID=148309 RepID=A0AAD5QTC7_PARTN|nr:hypothetical protein KIN20_024040 [Parelaphostrongylus tenuis]